MDFLVAAIVVQPIAKQLGELPVHAVTLSQPFYIGKTEVTQRQWSALMETNPSKYKGENRPVDSVNFAGAQASTVWQLLAGVPVV